MRTVVAVTSPLLNDGTLQMKIGCCNTAQNRAREYAG